MPACGRVMIAGAKERGRVLQRRGTKPRNLSRDLPPKLPQADTQRRRRVAPAPTMQDPPSPKSRRLKMKENRRHRLQNGRQVHPTSSPRPVALHRTMADPVLPTRSTGMIGGTMTMGRLARRRARSPQCRRPRLLEKSEADATYRRGPRQPNVHRSSRFQSLSAADLPIPYGGK